MFRAVPVVECNLSFGAWMETLVFISIYILREWLNYLVSAYIVCHCMTIFFIIDLREYNSVVYSIKNLIHLSKEYNVAYKLH